jgi:hypothetical protein
MVYDDDHPDDRKVDLSDYGASEGDVFILIRVRQGEDLAPWKRAAFADGLLPRLPVEDELAPEAAQ